LKEGRKRGRKRAAPGQDHQDRRRVWLLAEKISDDDYRVMMGQHKPVPADKLAHPGVKALNAMKPGDVSDLIQLDQAYTIVRLQVHTPAGKAKFEDAVQLAKELQQNQEESASLRPGQEAAAERKDRGTVKAAEAAVFGAG
jgi:peptidyl-prolyl cis-trans isomerase SurA